MAKPRYANVVVKMTGTNGNAWAIIGRVAGALKKNVGVCAAKDFVEEATAGDYENLLRVCVEYVTVT